MGHPFSADLPPETRKTLSRRLLVVECHSPVAHRGVANHSVAHPSGRSDVSCCLVCGQVRPEVQKADDSKLLPNLTNGTYAFPPLGSGTARSTLTSTMGVWS